MKHTREYQENNRWFSGGKKNQNLSKNPSHLPFPNLLYLSTLPFSNHQKMPVSLFFPCQVMAYSSLFSTARFSNLLLSFSHPFIIEGEGVWWHGIAVEVDGALGSCQTWQHDEGSLGADWCNERQVGMCAADRHARRLGCAVREKIGYCRASDWCS